MPCQIHFSRRASVEYDNLMDYVIFNFGMRTASEIEEDFDRLLNQMSLNPKIHPHPITLL